RSIASCPTPDNPDPQAPSGDPPTGQREPAGPRNSPGPRSSPKPAWTPGTTARLAAVSSSSTGIYRYSPAGCASPPVRHLVPDRPSPSPPGAWRRGGSLSRRSAGQRLPSTPSLRHLATLSAFGLSDQPTGGCRDAGALAL